MAGLSNGVNQGRWCFFSSVNARCDLRSKEACKEDSGVKPSLGASVPTKKFAEAIKEFLSGCGRLKSRILLSPVLTGELALNLSGASLPCLQGRGLAPLKGPEDIQVRMHT